MSGRRVVTFRLSPDELDLAHRAAAANHQTFSDFTRDALLTAAGDCLEMPGTARGSGPIEPTSGVIQPQEPGATMRYQDGPNRDASHRRR